jgi:hypothetical protein
VLPGSFVAISSSKSGLNGIGITKLADITLYRGLTQVREGRGGGGERKKKKKRGAATVVSAAPTHPTPQPPLFPGPPLPPRRPVRRPRQPGLRHRVRLLSVGHHDDRDGPRPKLHPDAGLLLRQRAGPGPPHPLRPVPAGRLLRARVPGARVWAAVLYVVAG